MNQSPSWEVNSCSVTQKNLPQYSWSRRLITMFTRARHWSLFWTRWIQPKTSYPTILILYSYLHLGLSSDLFPSSTSPTKILYARLTYDMDATYPAHLIFLELIILIIFGEERKLVKLWAYRNIQTYIGPTLTVDTAILNIVRINLSKDYPRRQCSSVSFGFTAVDFLLANINSVHFNNLFSRLWISIYFCFR
jgi:hypothetical protein